MRAVLSIDSGPFGGKRVTVPAGGQIRVGRTDKADVVVNDPQMSGAHFAVRDDGTALHLRDLRSIKGTFHNDVQITAEVILQHGDRIRAGETTFVVALVRAPDEGAQGAEAPEVAAQEAEAPATEVPEAEAPSADEHRRARWALLTGEIEEERPPADRLVALLHETPEPLFAVLDAARSTKVLTLLRASDAEHSSLYEGRSRETLAEQAPYLVRLPVESTLLPFLARAARGESWGIYLTSARSFAEVRKHLRRFLMVRDEDERELYFRFYDPRVLRLFLPAATPLQVSELFDGVGSFLVEDDGGASTSRFTTEGSAVRREVVAT